MIYLLRWHSKTKSFRKKIFIARWQFVRRKIKNNLLWIMRRSCYKIQGKLGIKFFSFDKCLNLICSNSFSLDISEMFRTWWKSMRFKLDIVLLYHDLDSLSSLLKTNFFCCKSLLIKAFFDIVCLWKKSAN